MCLDVSKPVFGGLRTTEAQTSLHIPAYRSAPLLQSTLDTSNFKGLGKIC